MKDCPKCDRFIVEETDICPCCGYNFITQKMPGELSAQPSNIDYNKITKIVEKPYDPTSHKQNTYSTETAPEHIPFLKGNRFKVYHLLIACFIGILLINRFHSLGEESFFTSSEIIEECSANAETSNRLNEISAQQKELTQTDLELRSTVYSLKSELDRLLNFEGYKNEYLTAAEELQKQVSELQSQKAQKETQLSSIEKKLEQ